MDGQSLEARFRGALLGVAIGDALGAPYEGGHPPHSVDVDQLLRRSAPLRYTDDTHMTLGVAESLVERRGFDGAHMGGVFVRNFNAEPWRGYGAGPPQVFRMIEQGVSWDKAGRTLFDGAGSYGNGAAMRVAPAALLAFRDLAEVTRLARQTAIITHAHSLGIEGAVLQAGAIALLLQGAPHSGLDKQQLLANLHSLVREPLYHQQLQAVKELLPGGTRPSVVARIGNGVAAHEAVPAALYAFLRHPDSFPEAVAYAIGLGGDTDTIASMTGALAGAYLGEQAVPEEWRDQVEDARRLRALADALLQLATGETLRG